MLLYFFDLINFNDLYRNRLRSVGENSKYVSARTVNTLDLYCRSLITSLYEKNRKNG